MNNSPSIAPPPEYEAVHNAGYVRRTDRALVRIHGRDPLRMIQGIITNDIAGAPPERAVYAAMLTPKGRMIADMRVYRFRDELRIETDAGARADVMATLRKYVPPLFARAEAMEDTAVLGVYGPDAHTLLADVLGPDNIPAPEEYALSMGTLEPESDPRPESGAAPDARPQSHGRPESDAGDQPDPRPQPGPPAFVVLATRYAGVAGLDVIAKESVLDRIEGELRAAGVSAISLATLDVLRIEAGRARWGTELTGETIPIEAGLERTAISNTKGCYTGQEVIVRILHRGHVNRHLRGLRLGGATPPSGTALVDPDSGKTVGTLTSVCISPRAGQTIALGYVRREVEPPATIRLESVDGAPVEVVTLPFFNGGAQ